MTLILGSGGNRYHVSMVIFCYGVQMLERMLSKAEEGEVRARREMKALKRDHSESIEQVGHHRALPLQ